MILSIPKAKAAEFERSIQCNPMIDVLVARVRNASVEYEIDAPSFINFPDYAVAL